MDPIPKLLRANIAAAGKKLQSIHWIVHTILNPVVEIDGETYSNNMAPHNFLSDQEIADVLTYVRNSFGNKASAIKAAEVKVVRATAKK